MYPRKKKKNKKRNIQKNKNKNIKLSRPYTHEKGQNTAVGYQEPNSFVGLVISAKK